MSLYANYVKELCGKEVLENENGFVVFFPFNDGLYIQDIYVVPAFREKNYASSLADQVAEIAISRGLKKLYGSVKPSNNNSTISLKVLLAYGFKLDSSVVDGIALVKEL